MKSEDEFIQGLGFLSCTDLLNLSLGLRYLTLERPAEGKFIVSEIKSKHSNNKSVKYCLDLALSKLALDEIKSVSNLDPEMALGKYRSLTTLENLDGSVFDGLKAIYFHNFAILLAKSGADTEEVMEYFLKAIMLDVDESFFDTMANMGYYLMVKKIIIEALRVFLELVSKLDIGPPKQSSRKLLYLGLVGAINELIRRKEDCSMQEAYKIVSQIQDLLLLKHPSVYPPKLREDSLDPIQATKFMEYLRMLLVGESDTSLVMSINSPPKLDVEEPSLAISSNGPQIRGGLSDYGNDSKSSGLDQFASPSESKKVVPLNYFDKMVSHGSTESEDSMKNFFFLPVSTTSFSKRELLLKTYERYENELETHSPQISKSSFFVSPSLPPNEKKLKAKLSSADISEWIPPSPSLRPGASISFKTKATTHSFISQVLNSDVGIGHFPIGNGENKSALSIDSAPKEEERKNLLEPLYFEAKHPNNSLGIDSIIMESNPLDLDQKTSKMADATTTSIFPKYLQEKSTQTSENYFSLSPASPNSIANKMEDSENLNKSLTGSREQDYTYTSEDVRRKLFELRRSESQRQARSPVSVSRYYGLRELVFPGPYPIEVDVKHRELYLHEDCFLSTFGMSKLQWVEQPLWKQVLKKKEKGLF